MEPGFVGVDDSSLKINLNSFDGLELDLNSSVAGVIKDSNGREYKVEVDKTGIYGSRVRPVVYDQLVGNGRVSRTFDNVLGVSLKLNRTPVDIASRKTPFTYPVVPQVDFLAVRTIPRGSSTTLEDLKKRQAEAAALLSGEAKPAKKQKKDKHHKEESSKPSKSEVAPVVTPTPAVVEVESEEKKKKKKKKDKSNKD